GQAHHCAEGGEDCPVVSFAEHHGQAGGVLGVDAAAFNVDVAALQLAQDQAPGGVVADDADVCGAHPEACGARGDDRPRGADGEDASIDDALDLPVLRLERFHQHDRIEVELADHHQVEAAGAHRTPTDGCSRVASTIGTSASTAARSTRPGWR